SPNRPRRIGCGPGVELPPASNQSQYSSASACPRGRQVPPRGPSQRFCGRTARGNATKSHSTAYSGQLHDFSDGGCHCFPTLRFQIQLLSARGGQPVKAGASPQFGGRPASGNEAFVLQTMQCGIERTLIHLEYVLGDLLNALGNRPPMEGIVLQGPEDQQVECPLQ